MEASESALVEFFSECDEILQRFSSKLSEAEKAGNADAETISALYRDMHTLKGSAQLFGFRLISQISHAMEAALEPIRRLKLQIPAPLIDALFKSIDLIDRVVKESSMKKAEVSDQFEIEAKTVVPLLLSVASDHFGGEFNLIDNRVPILETETSTDPLADKNAPQNSATSLASNATLPDAPGTPAEPVLSITPSLVTHTVARVEPSPGVISVSNLAVSSAARNDSGSALSAANKVTLDSIPVPPILTAVSKVPVAPSKPSVPESVAKDVPKDASESVDSNSTVRIHVSLLDKLMNLVGEMVLVRNQMLQYAQKHDTLEFLNLSQRLNLVTSELQGDVMKTRMQPIGTILAKFQRLVRDLAKDLGKGIELTLKGSETELDKTLLEAIKDPLTHIIRNSCDHGLEKAEERIQSGKPSTGHINIQAFHEGGHVIIEVSDDGRGLNVKRIFEKALEKKIITQEQASKLNDRDIKDLIFAPGFSTAENVTSVSGRGVGMDVVKTNLAKIGGQVELQSELGQGMIVRLRIPLTLAIVPALIVRAGGEQFAIPQVKLAELVRVERDGNGPKIEILQGKPVFRLRGHLLSLIELKQVLGLNDGKSLVSSYESVNIVILNGDGESFGLIVDEIRDTADIVVKPLSNFLKKIQIYSGATIMGDGGVSLILDVAGLAQKSHLFQKTSRREISAQVTVSDISKNSNKDIQDFLFFKLNSVESYCLPLCFVHRLEEFPATDIQHSGRQRMVKYRDSILPIISLNEFFSLPKKPLAGSSEKSSKVPISLIVVQRKAKLYGIEVNEVVDILSVSGAIEDPVRETKGILGSIIVDKEVETVIDVFFILDEVLGYTAPKSSNPEISSKAAKPPKSLAGLKVAPVLKSGVTKNVHILFAEDTVFFMKQVRKVLEKNGYQVTHAADGALAWQILNSSKPGDYQLVLSDIEMPKMTGFELAAKIRGDSRFASTPLVALTTKFREVDRERGLEVGFTRYLEKLRSDELLTALHELLEE